MTASLAQLHRIARTERARRQTAWAAEGQHQSDRARHDDVIWSNIVMMVGQAAGDRDCLKDGRLRWNSQQVDVMERRTRATALQMESKLDMSDPKDLNLVRGLWQLYRWVREQNPAFATAGPEYLRAPQEGTPT
jgi:hypothetical protein